MKLKNLLIILQHDIKRKVCNFFRRLKNFLEYAIFIWKEDIYAEYDYWFIYKFIRFKLQRMAKTWSSARFYVGYQQDLKDMYKVIDLINQYYNLESFNFLPNSPTEEDFIQNEKKADKAWVKLHTILSDNARKWWY